MTMKTKSGEDRKRKALFKKVSNTQEEGGEVPETEDAEEGDDEEAAEEAVDGDGGEGWVDEAEAGDAEAEAEALDQLELEGQAEGQAEEGEEGDDDKPVHEATCDGCKMSPIKGARYKCLE
jgi:Zinc finger, ZZ type